MPSSDSETILSVEALTRDFAAVRALDEVNLSFRPGEVHGIVGENGAGKSTLMKVISGLYRPTAGRLVYRGEPVEMTGPARAMHMGIAMVHQELNLVDELSVAENVFLGRELTNFGLVRRSEMADRAQELLARVGCTADPHAKLGTLPIAQQQMVEIAKSLSYDASILIMDEPTAVLAQPEMERLFALIGRLREDGVTVLYISHILPEVLRICDRITVMRDGRIVRTLDRQELADGREAEARLASLMVGRALADHFPEKGRPARETVLRVEGLSVPEHVADLSFELAAGEVLGFAGLVGAGRTEMAEAIAGFRTRSAGAVHVNGRELPPLEPREAVRNGVAYLSEDRRGRGLVMGRSVTENMTLVSLRRYCTPLISRRREREAAERQIRRLSIRVGSTADPIDTLSGGNQQKVALAKWLEVEPKVLLLDEPTRGVDIGAKEEIYRIIQELAGRGMGCVFISSELNELLGTCTRIAVMRGGRLVVMLEGDQMTEEEVMLHAAGVKAGGPA